MRITFLAVVTVAVILTPAAMAQVFVIGESAAAACYQKTVRAFGFSSAAEKACSEALADGIVNRSDRAATYVNRGVMRMRDGRYDQALLDYDNALRLNAGLGAAYLNRGANYIYMRDYARALPELNKAIDLKTSYLFAAYYNRAIAKENTGDVPGAYEDFQTALKLRPDWDLAEQQLSRFTVTPD